MLLHLSGECQRDSGPLIDTDTKSLSHGRDIDRQGPAGRSTDPGRRLHAGRFRTLKATVAGAIQELSSPGPLAALGAVDLMGRLPWLTQDTTHYTYNQKALDLFQKALARETEFRWSGVCL